MDNSALDLARAQQSGSPELASKSGERTERIYKMFTSAERAEIIKNNPVRVKIGSGEEQREVVIRPLSPRQVINAYGLIRDILIPIMRLYEPGENGEKKNIGLTEFVGALGENIDKLVDLIHAILSRGNTISKDWLDEHMDLVLDAQIIIPIFLEQNGLMKLLGKDRAPEDLTPKSQDPGAKFPLTAV